MTTTLPTITHRIAYDRTTRDFACYVQIDGDPEQYIGSAASYHAGETTCLDYRHDLLESDVFRTATELDGICGDCGQTLDNQGLCGCQAEEPTRNALGYCPMCSAPPEEPCMCETQVIALSTCPTPLNTDDTPLTAAWRAYKAGAMDWSDVQAIQASLMPRCDDHNRPAAIYLNKRPACIACMDEAEQLVA